MNVAGLFTSFLTLCGIIVFTLSTAWSASVQNCVYCLGGKRVPNGANPASNGCGPTFVSMFLKSVVTPAMEECCNVHDHCYSDCLMDRKTCDLEFEQCLRDQHDSKYEYGLRQYVTFFPRMVTRVGCLAYIFAQQETCDCIHD